MKNFFKLFSLLFFAMMLTAHMAQAQLVPANSAGIFQPPTLNLNGKFTAIGESGGVPGRTVNGCDLYGFRAQVDSTNAVNLGMQAEDFGGPTSFDIPTLSFRGLPLTIAQEAAPGIGNGVGTGCGKALAAYFDNLPAPTGFPFIPNIVYAVYGSAFASGGIWFPSDQRLKKDIAPVRNALDMIDQLEGVTYQYRVDERPELNLNQGMQYGFIAQDVKKVMPEAVQPAFNRKGEVDDYEMMNYTMIIPVLTEAIKEQQEIIESLEERLSRLEAKNDDNSTLPKSSKIGLSQNRPNPFSGVTTIEYDIPLSLNNAQLVIYDTKGSVLKITDIDSGKGNIDFDAANLSSGVYIYSVEVDGKSMARKRMIVR